MKINDKETSNNIFYKIYLAGFLVILALPLLTMPPWFFPPDWGKTIVFRSILSALLLLFAFQLLYKRNSINLPVIKRSKIIWLLLVLLAIFLLATAPYVAILVRLLE